MFPAAPGLRSPPSSKGLSLLVCVECCCYLEETGTARGTWNCTIGDRRQQPCPRKAPHNDSKPGCTRSAPHAPSPAPFSPTATVATSVHLPFALSKKSHTRTVSNPGKSHKAPTRTFCFKRSNKSLQCLSPCAHNDRETLLRAEGPGRCSERQKPRAAHLGLEEPDMPCYSLGATGA